MKKPHPIKFRAIHTKNRWRTADHESIENALGKTRGARALFGHLNRAINYSKEGEPNYVIIWHEDATEGEIVKPDHAQRDGLRHAPIAVVDIERFERDGPPPDAELERYFLPHSDGAARRDVALPPEDIIEPKTLADLEFDLKRRIEVSSSLTAAQRQARLKNRDPIPRRVDVQTTAFLRSADVIVEVLARAAGVCEECHRPAPFRRAKDGTPYLEVHHRKPLALGGEDTFENAVALCPNCHRRNHYGNSAT